MPKLKPRRNWKRQKWTERQLGWIQEAVSVRVSVMQAEKSDDPWETEDNLKALAEKCRVNDFDLSESERKWLIEEIEFLIAIEEDKLSAGEEPQGCHGRIYSLRRMIEKL